jgi:triphosphatase
MELELGLDPDEAARLPRLRLIAPLRSGAARSRAVRMVWHDSTDRALAGQGLALTSLGSLWRLERLYPDEGRWLPAAPPATVATGREPAALGHSLPEPLVPVAAFEGRSRSFSLVDEQGAVAMTLLSGTVRGVASERRVARVRLEGAAEAVQGLATRLAAEVHLAVPHASLSAEALEIGAGVPLTEPDGAPEPPSGLSIAQAFAHVVGHLTGVILHYAPSARDQQGGVEPVHQMRVAVRRLRSVIRVFGRAVHDPAVGTADRDLKALAARLAPARDWDVFVTETCAAVLAAFPAEKRLQRLVAGAEKRQQSYHDELSVYLSGGEFRRLGIELACLVAGLSASTATTPAPEGDALPEQPLEGFAAHMLNKRLKRLVQADDSITELEPAALHALRLRAKRLRYAAEIFAPLYGKPARRYLQGLGKLQDRLGALNDAAVAANLLAELGGNSGGHAFASGLILGYIGARSQRTRARMAKSWRKFNHAARFWG